MEFERGAARGEIGYFEILPADAALPAGAYGLHAGFLGGKAAGIAFEAVGFALDIGDLGRGVDAVDETAAIARDGGADAVDFGEVHAGSQNHFSSAPDVVMVRRPCLTPLVLMRASAIF